MFIINIILNPFKTLSANCMTESIILVSDGKNGRCKKKFTSNENGQ